jgi:hypothetical protein
VVEKTFDQMNADFAQGHISAALYYLMDSFTLRSDGKNFTGGGSAMGLVLGI